MVLLALAWIGGCEGDLPLPSARRGARGAIGGGDLWVVGGEDAGGLSKEVWTYNLADQQWRRHGDAPMAMAWGAVAWDGAAFIVLAGSTEDGPSDAVWRLDPRADSWDTLAPMPAPRARFGAAMVGDTVTLTGGLGPDGLAYGDAWSLSGGIWNRLSEDLGVGGFADVSLIPGEGTTWQVGGTIAESRDYLYILRDEEGLVRTDVGLGPLQGACGVADGTGFWLWDGLAEGITWSFAGGWVAHEDEEVPPPRGFPLCAISADAVYVWGGDPSFGVGGEPFLADLWRLRDGAWKQVLAADGTPVAP